MSRAKTVRELLHRHLGKSRVLPWKPTTEAFYLRASLPVILNRLTTCGWAVDDESEYAVDVSRIYFGRIARARIFKWTYGGGHRGVNPYHRDHPSFRHNVISVDRDQTLTLEEVQEAINNDGTLIIEVNASFVVHHAAWCDVTESTLADLVKDQDLDETNIDSFKIIEVNNA